MRKTASDAQEARARARARRLALYADRAAKDERIESSVAAVLMATADRDLARQAATRAEQVIGSALRDVLSEGVSIRGAAELCDLTVSEIRRLVRPLANEVR